MEGGLAASLYPSTHLNITGGLTMSFRKIGGIRFLRIGRLHFTWAVSKQEWA